MSLDFNLRDTLHNVIALFRRNTLPNAKKPYNLYAVEQPALDVHGIASKAEVYNIETSPKVIEEGMNAAIELMYYLASDGYKINTPLFDLHIRIPGEYDGTETHLPDGVHPEASISVSVEFRRYLAERVQVSILGKEDVEGSITLVTDLGTNLHDSISRGGAFSVEGAGLKITADAAHDAECGLWFVNENTPADRLKCTILIDNEPRRLTAMPPVGIMAGTKYYIEIITQSSARNGSAILKSVRSVRSEQPYLTL